MVAIGHSSAEVAQENKKTYEALPEGTYNAEVLSVKYRPVDKEICYWKKHDDEIVFEFVITAGEYKGRHFWRDVPADMADTRLRLILQEIIGTNSLPDDFVLDTEDFDQYFGLPCRIRLNQYVSKAKGTTHNGVEDVIAALPSQFKKKTEAAYEEPF